MWHSARVNDGDDDPGPHCITDCARILAVWLAQDQWPSGQFDIGFTMCDDCTAERLSDDW